MLEGRLGEALAADAVTAPEEVDPGPAVDVCRPPLLTAIARASAAESVACSCASKLADGVRMCVFEGAAYSS